MNKKACRTDAEILIFSLAIYTVNRYWLKNVMTIPEIKYILQCHFNDYIGGISIIYYINIVLCLSNHKEWQINSLGKAIGIGLLCGILWEILFPMVLPRGTSDWLDIVAYIMGSATYVLINNIVLKYAQMHKKPTSCNHSKCIWKVRQMKRVENDTMYDSLMNR